MRKIHLMNEGARDATVAIESVRERAGATMGLPGKKLQFRRYVASAESGLHDKLAAQFGDKLGQALLDGDPEIDREVVGRVAGDTQTVFLSSSGEVLHASPSLVDVLYAPGLPPYAGTEWEGEVWTGDYARLILAPDRQAYYAKYRQDITPTTDDRPFFFHTTKIKDQFHTAFGRSMLFGNGLSALLTLMAISALLVLLFVIGPLVLTFRGSASGAGR